MSICSNRPEAHAEGDRTSGRGLQNVSYLTQALFAVLLLALLSLAGCSGEKRVAVVQVKGSVGKFRNETPVGANVVLRSANGAAAEAVPSAKVKDDGSFEFTTYDVGDGAPPGEYVLTIEWFKIVGEGRGPNVLPKKFGSPDTSPVKVSVAGPTEIPPVQFTN